MTSEAACPDEAACHELLAYTLGHADPAFVHQRAVDACAAQHPSPGSSPIRVAFALIGLCLHLERGYSGREVQRAHVRMGALRAARRSGRPHRPRRPPRAARPARDRAIRAWCAAVWRVWVDQHARIRALLQEAGE